MIKATMDDAAPSADQMDQLGFTPEWFSAGVLTHSRLASLAEEFERSTDKNTEHYRFKAFSRYVHHQGELSDEQFRQLFVLAESDPDRPAGSSMLWELIIRKDCPCWLLEQAAASSRISLSMKAKALLRPT